MASQDDGYIQNFPYGTPFGDGPQAEVSIAGKGRADGFYLGTPRMERLPPSAPGQYRFYGEDERSFSVTVLPGDSFEFRLIASGSHTPNLLGYGTGKLGDARLMPGTIDTRTVRRMSPPGGGTRLWSDGPWTGGPPAPNAACEIASLEAVSQATTVSLDTNVTLGRSLIDSAVGSYTVAGPGSLTLACGSSDVGINVLAGTHAISAALNVQNNVVFSTTGASDALSITGATSFASGINVTAGGLGTVSIGRFTANELSVVSGKLRSNALSGTAVRVARLTMPGTIATGVGAGALDLVAAGSGLVVDADTVSEATGLTTLNASPMSIVDRIKNGFTGGTWSGSTSSAVASITSSAASANNQLGIGYATSTQILGSTGGTFLGQSVDGSTVLLRVTYRGDVDLDGDVDFDDLVRLSQNYNGTGKYWCQGDFDYDGDVDFDDQVKLSQNYGGAPLLQEQLATLASISGENFMRDYALAQSLVPEPLTIGSASGFALLMLRRRR